MIDILEIEREISKREAALVRVRCRLDNIASRDFLLEQEAYLLEDQLSMYRTLNNLLKDEQPEHDEMLKTV